MKQTVLHIDFQNKLLCNKLFQYSALCMIAAFINISRMTTFFIFGKLKIHNIFPLSEAVIVT